jgi:hypothetical protein
VGYAKIASPTATGCRPSGSLEVNPNVAASESESSSKFIIQQIHHPANSSSSKFIIQQVRHPAGSSESS